MSVADTVRALAASSLSCHPRCRSNIPARCRHTRTRCVCVARLAVAARAACLAVVLYGFSTHALDEGGRGRLCCVAASGVL